MSPRESQRGETSLAAVFQTLSEDVLLLFREHLRLFRLELKQDASIAGRYFAAMAFFGIVALVGFGLLSVTAILFAGWAFGVLGMAITALVLSAVHLGFGLHAFAKIAGRLKTDELGPRLAGEELDRSRKWMTQLPGSPPSS
jgi:hypothetical protein